MSIQLDNSNSASAAEGPVFTAIAVCGCGHDGRLGIGVDAPPTVSEISIIDDFLPNLSDVTNLGEIIQVSCGAYHTLLLTSTGLHGWGLHEDGQLGLGRPATAGAIPMAAATVDSSFSSPDATAAAVPSHVDKPLRIPLTELIGIYVTGRNDCGQLGLGHTNNVYTWTRLCAALPLPETGNRNGTETRGTRSAASPIMSFLPSVCDSNPGGAHARLLYGCLTHVSCGTHHTLLAWSDAIVFRMAAPSSGDPQGRTLDANDRCEAVYYPSLVMACGRGDFGELGYDGNPWEVMQAKSQRQERALRSALQQQQHHGGDVDAQNGANDSAYKFKWKAAAGIKPRRPPFNSTFFEVVRGLKHLEKSAVTLAASSLEEVCAALPHGDHTAHALAENVIRRLRESTETSYTSPPPTAPALETSSSASSRWEVENLQAMHLHSAVTLRQRGAAQSEKLVVLHWGCYYCSDIEDEAASHPRPAFSDVIEALSDEDAGVIVTVCHGWCGGIHAGEETLLRYGVPCVPAVSTTLPSGAPSLQVPMLQVMGSGNLGLGTDDSFTRDWVDLTCSDGVSATGSQATVQSVVGRSHYLISMNTQGISSSVRCSSKEGVCLPSASTTTLSSCVFGFGDNLHGQLGAPALRAGDASKEDVVVTPRVVLKKGDVLRVASAVKRSLQDASAPPVHPRRAGAKNIVEAPASPVVVHSYEVVAIRAAGAGARHSVFLVDVSPVATTAGI